MDIEAKNEQELQEALVVVRKKKLKKKIISIAIVTLIILATFVMVFIYGYNAAKNNAQEEIVAAQNNADYWEDMYNKLKEVPVVLEPVTPEIVQKVLSSKTAEISELASAEYIFTNAAKFTDTKHIVKIFDWMTEKSFVQKWDGKIKAGIKLDNLEVSIKDNIITITMPYAEILSYEIDKNSVEVLDEQNNTFNPITVEDKVNFDRETEYSMKARAVENGLLEKAQKNAENIIANLLTAAIENIEDYEIEFVIADK